MDRGPEPLLVQTPVGVCGRDWSQVPVPPVLGFAPHVAWGEVGRPGSAMLNTLLASLGLPLMSTPGGSSSAWFPVGPDPWQAGSGPPADQRPLKALARAHTHCPHAHHPGVGMSHQVRALSSGSSWLRPIWPRTASRDHLWSPWCLGHWGSQALPRGAAGRCTPVQETLKVPILAEGRRLGPHFATGVPEVGGWQVVPLCACFLGLTMMIK